MDIFYLTCPRCSGEYYGDVSLLSLDVAFHCPFCGSYFSKKEAGGTAGGAGISPIVRMSRDKTFFKPVSEEE